MHRILRKRLFAGLLLSLTTSCVVPPDGWVATSVEVVGTVATVAAPMMSGEGLELHRWQN